MITLRRKHTTSTQPLVTYSFSASSLSNGSYTADSLSPDFTNTAGSKYINSGIPVIDPTNDNAFVLQTINSRRDQSVDTWIGKGTIFLRINGGTAIFFHHNVEATNGQIRIGVITPSTGSISAGPTPDEFGGITLWLSNNLYTDVPNYTKSEGSNYFTFSVKGFEINLQYNGVDVPLARMTDYRIPMDTGTTGIKLNSNYGVRMFNVTHLSPMSLYSNYAGKIIDARDFGLKEGTTTGSTIAGQYTITVANGSLYQPTDYILVPPGYEAAYNGRAAGTQGTPGPGSTFPLLSYPNVAAMNADTTQLNGTLAWLQDTGATKKYVSSSSSWVQSQTFFVEDHYYINKAIPIAYFGQIVSISGNVLTMDKAFNTTFTNAPVYFDNSFVYNKLGADPSNDRFPYKYPIANADARVLTNITTSGWTIKTPAGNFAIGQRVTIRNRDTHHFVGAGIASTRIFSPQGCPAFSISREYSVNGINEGYTAEGNVKDNGFGYNWWGWDERLSAQWPTQQYVRSSLYFPTGHMIGVGSHNCEYRNIHIKNVWAGGVATSYANNVYVHDCSGESEEGIHFYPGWYFQSADSNNAFFSRCTFTSPKVVPIFEQFGGTGAVFDDCHSTNGLFAANSANNFTYTNCSFIGTTDSFSPDWHSNLAPVMNINQNAAGGGYGGLVQNCTFNITEVNANHDAWIGIIINAGCNGITIKDCTVNTPNYVAPSSAGGGRGIKAEGNNLIIDGLHVTGTGLDDGFYTTNIAVKVDATSWPTGRSAVVKNCVAGQYYLGTEVTQGTGAEANTGTVIVI